MSCYYGDSMFVVMVSNNRSCAQKVSFFLAAAKQSRGDVETSFGSRRPHQPLSLCSLLQL